MALLPEIQKLLTSPSLPELGPGPREGVLSQKAVDTAVDEVLTHHALSPNRKQLLRALVLLWHDYFEPAHEIVQDGEDADSAYLHAILHRREPDYGNAKYWFRRVGPHPCYDGLASKVSTLLQADGESKLSAQLVPQGRWDPSAFVDACASASKYSPDDHHVKRLREIQAVEFEVLGEYLCKLT